MPKKTGLAGGAIIAGIVLLFGFTILMSSYTRIEHGTVGMVTRFGRIQNRVRGPGLTWKIPFVDKIIIYHTQDLIYVTEDEPDAIEAQEGVYLDYPTDTTTSDGQQITVKYSVRFSIDPERVTSLASEFGDQDQIVEKLVKFETRVLARNIPKKYQALDLYTGQIQEVQDEFETQLRPILGAKGVILDSFGLRKIDFQEDYVQAIEQKQIEAENVITERNRAEQAKWKAQSAIEEAKGEAEAIVERARGEAEQIKLLAEAEAEAIRLKGEMLSRYPNIVQLEFVQSLSDPESNVTWGIMPQDGVLPFLNVTPEAGSKP